MTGLEKLIKNIWNGIRDDEFGQNGALYITTAATDYTGNWKAIKCITDVTFTTLTTSKGDDFDGIVLTAGDVVYGPFTKINISAGSVLAYNKNN
jgi:hypothetical protein